METISITFSSDNNYAPYLGVTLCSIFENKKENYLIDIYVLDGGIEIDNIKKIKILEDKYNFKVNYIKIDTSLYKSFYTSQYITQAAYYRILIPELLPFLKKTLYLDCDIIVTGDIYELYNINIDNYPFAAVEEYITDRQEQLGMPTGIKYFNSGVILINIEKWRKYNICQTLIDFIKKNPDILKYHDQDAMNAILYNRWLDIPFRYNYMTSLWDKYPINYKQIEQKILILHYTSLKPWDYSNSHPLTKKYIYYLKKTPWKNINLINKTFKRIIQRITKNIIFFILPNFVITFLKKIRKI